MTRDELAAAFEAVARRPLKTNFDTVEQVAYMGVPRETQLAYTAAITDAGSTQKARNYFEGCLKRGLPTQEARRACWNEAVEVHPPLLPWRARLPRPTGRGTEVSWAGAPVAILLASYSPEQHATATREHDWRDEVGTTGRLFLDVQKQLETAQRAVKWAIGGAIAAAAVAVAVAVRRA